ncbi:MAG: ShlB/FhaC/HecB family hemolysin secretion/activation protein [Phycisphaerae bacterium]|nr:ShlB/FhaC/HecB family hemolysin secretion/activation protein [Phycisphaerae bacterium]
MGRAREDRKFGVMGFGGAWVLAMCAGMAAGVRAQDAQPPAQPPVDPPEAKAPEGKAEDAGVFVKVDDAAADSRVYPISRVLIVHGRDHAGQPDLQDERFQNLTVRLGKTPEGYAAAGTGDAVTLKLADLTEGSGGMFRKSAIEAIAGAIVGELNRRGVYGVHVAPSDEDINEDTGEDMRDGRTALVFVVYTAIVKDVRTIARGERFEGEQSINHPAHANVRARSPVVPGSLLRKDKLDDYAYQLKRHPGRVVDIAVSAADEEGGAQVDYLVGENKPWTLYFQISNTGTKNTEDWRERFGFTHNQLTNHDDILQLEYSTAGFDSSHAITPSYEFPLLSNKLRAKVYGSWTDFTASDVGLSEAKFTGDGWSLGGELAWNVAQWGPAFLDLVGGARWQNVHIRNETDPINVIEGEDDFFMPYVGARLTRDTNFARTYAEALVEFNVSGMAGTEEAEIGNMGRSNPDDEFAVFRWDLTQSLFIEPLFNPRGGTADGKGMTLAHELVGSFRGQNALGSRLVPTFEAVAGGFYSVRGYPESVVAGDNSVVASFEYRFHIPNAFTAREPTRLFGRDFRATPQTPYYGTADWDLIAKAFIDVGRVTNNDRLSFENDETLVGAGLGLELQVLRNVNVRADWGVAMEEVNKEGGGEFVSDGSSRFHLSFTLLF